MTSDQLPVPLERVPCDVCQHDIPLSEAVVAEATDYVVYFCGLDCYDSWRRQREPINIPLADISETLSMKAVEIDGIGVIGSKSIAAEETSSKCRAQIIGKVEYRQGEGILFAIPVGAADVEVTPLDITFSWIEGNVHAAAAMPFLNFCRYLIEGAIKLECPTLKPCEPR